MVWRRADSVSAVDLAGQRAVVKLGRSRSREELRAWVPDDRLGVFVVGVGGRAPRREELWKMRMLHQLDGVPSAAVETPPVSSCTHAVCVCVSFVALLP